MWLRYVVYARRRYKELTKGRILASMGYFIPNAEDCGGCPLFNPCYFLYCQYKFTEKCRLLDTSFEDDDCYYDE